MIVSEKKVEQAIRNYLLSKNCYILSDMEDNALLAFDEDENKYLIVVSVGVFDSMKDLEVLWKDRKPSRSRCAEWIDKYTSQITMSKRDSGIEFVGIGLVVVNEDHAILKAERNWM